MLSILAEDWPARVSYRPGVPARRFRWGGIVSRITFQRLKAKGIRMSRFVTYSPLYGLRLLPLQNAESHDMAGETPNQP